MKKEKTIGTFTKVSLIDDGIIFTEKRQKIFTNDFLFLFWLVLKNCYRENAMEILGNVGTAVQWKFAHRDFMGPAQFFLWIEIHSEPIQK